MKANLVVAILALVLGATMLAASGCGGDDGDERSGSTGGSGGNGGPGGGGTGGDDGLGGSGGTIGSGGTGAFGGVGGSGGSGGQGGTGDGGTGGIGGGGSAGSGGSGGEASTGGGGTGGAGGGGGTGGWVGNTSKALSCPGTSTGCQCSDGIDNDGDGLIDEFDPECSGPYDNDESSYATGIPGDNKGSNAATECFFDGNSGKGNDASCYLWTPNGCDCYGCCLIDLNGNGTYESTGMFMPGCGTSRDGGDEGMEGGPCRSASSSSGRCDAGLFCRLDGDGVTEFCSFCGTCEQNTDCQNPCEPGENCIGDPPGSSSSGGGGSGGSGGAGGAGGTGGTGGSVGTGGSGGTGGPVGGTKCPSGRQSCVTSADCPGASEFCVTGCCAIFQ